MVLTMRRRLGDWLLIALIVVTMVTTVGSMIGQVYLFMTGN